MFLDVSVSLRFDSLQIILVRGTFCNFCDYQYPLKNTHLQEIELNCIPTLFIDQKQIEHIT